MGQTGLGLFALQFVRLCGNIPASKCTWAKPRFGIQEECAQLHATCWRGLLARTTPTTVRSGFGVEVVNRERGISVLGTPLGHPDFAAVHLQKILEEHRILLGRIPLLSDLQSAWALLLHCASGRANCQLRSVRPELVAEFAAGHDQGMWQCLQTILNVPEESTALTRAITSLPLSLGGLGLRHPHQPQCMVGQLG